MNEPQRRGRGAPRGNRNALKSGLYAAPMVALRKDTRLKLQKINAAIALARLSLQSEFANEQNLSSPAE